jgi:CRISPR/Cas system-associated exonuclease Cas4 (RecB family)
MPQAGFTFSQSSLQDYTDCPRRFQLRYLEALEYPALESEPSAAFERQQREGQQFHRMVQQFILGIPKEVLTKNALSPDLLRWWQDFLSFYKRELEGVQTLTPELSISAPLGKFRLLAKFDLLAVDVGGRFRIYDWKTYRKRPQDDRLAARWQTRVYRALLVQASTHFNHGKTVPPDNCEMVYWFANYPDQPARFMYSENQFNRDWGTLENLVVEISNASASATKQEELFPKTDNLKQCSYCTYRSYCARGIQAGQLESAEFENEDDESFDVDFEQIGEIAF